MDSKIVKFFLFNDPNDDGRTIWDILKMKDRELEECHNVIQWMFPLPEKSNYHPDAPILTEEDVTRLKSYRWEVVDQISPKIEQCKNRFKQFLVDSVFTELDWSRPNHPSNKCNHNWLRVTRAIRSLRILGYQSFAKELFDLVEPIGTIFQLDETLIYWRKAYNDPIAFPKPNDSIATEGTGNFFRLNRPEPFTP